MSITNSNITVKQDIKSDMNAYAMNELTTFYSETISDIKNNAFYYLNSLKKLECPNLKIITGLGLFSVGTGASLIEEIILPSLEEWPKGIVFRNFAYLKKVVLSSVKFTGGVSTAFAGSAVEEIDLSSLIEIPARSGGTAFFANCWYLKTIHLDSLEKILDQGAFQYCKALEEITLPKVIEIERDCFTGCENLKIVNLPEMIYMPNRIFQTTNAELVEINAPKLELVGQSAFQGLPKFTSANFPSLKEAHAMAFSGNNISEVNLPSLEKLVGGAFFSNKSITHLDFPALQIIEGIQTFASCTNLKTLILRADTIVTFTGGGSASSSFQSSGITTSVGEIFVPAHLLTSYKSASSQWYSFRNRIFSL